jgi:hypothetical protein
MDRKTLPHKVGDDVKVVVPGRWYGHYGTVTEVFSTKWPGMFEVDVADGTIQHPALFKGIELKPVIREKR